MAGWLCNVAWVGRAAPWVAMVVWIAGCGGGDSGRLPLSGTVKWQGRPLEKGSILFVPAAGHSGPKIGAPVVNGGYKIDEERGATPGAYRVEVWSDTGEYPHSPTDARPRSKTPRPQEQIPAEYNRRSRLTALVAVDQTTFDFALPIPNLEPVGPSAVADVQP